MLLALLVDRHPAAHAKVIGSLRHAAEIANAVPVQWLPVEIDVEVCDAIARQLSPSQMDALVSERQRQEMGSALFKTFVATTGKLFGFTPATFIRHLNRGWRQVLQDCGEMETVKLEKNEAQVMLRALPEVCLESSAWLGALPAGMRVLFELVNTAGDVTATLRRPDVELRFTW
jgi:hypothetical protein